MLIHCYFGYSLPERSREQLSWSDSFLSCDISGLVMGKTKIFNVSFSSKVFSGKLLRHSSAVFSEASDHISFSACRSL